MASRLWLLVRILYNPLGAIPEIKARSPYLISGILATASTFIYFGVFNGNIEAIINAVRYPASPVLFVALLKRSMGAVSPVLFLAGLFVPACLLAVSLIGRRSSFTYLFKLEYAGLTSCVLYAWAASHLIMLIPDWLLLDSGRLVPVSESGALQLAIWLAPLPYFIFLVALALKVIFKLSLPRTAVVVALSSMSLIGVAV